MSGTVFQVEYLATSPIHHGEFSDIDTGNISPVRKLKVITRSGDKFSIPVISGNSIRGIMRRIVFGHLLEKFSVRATLLEAGESDAWELLYAALMNGGNLKGPQSNIDPKAYRAMRKAFPPLSLFGSALFDHQLAGRMEVGYVFPVCAESHAAKLVSIPLEDEAGLLPSSDLIDEIGLVRHTDEKTNGEVTGVTPMPMTIEVINAGTRLQQRIVVKTEDEIAVSIIVWALKRITVLGGKSNSGHGQVEVEIIGLDELGLSEAPYLEWIEVQDVGQILVDLALSLAPKKKAKKAKKGKK